MHNDINSIEIKALFLDIGGVLLTNGWGDESRSHAIEKFGLNTEEIEARHKIVFDAYELGKVTFDEYLDWVIFYQQRNFSKEDFRAFMFEQSQALDGSIDFFKELKEQYHLKVIAVSNEGRELNEYRIQHFKLDELFDAYISSCYVHLHKPDKDMLRMACDVSHIPAKHALYVDDTLILVDIASSIGFQTLHFQRLDTAKDFIKTCRFYKQPDKK
jgi:putative hydrolase of the HAD superfamily